MDNIRMDLGEVGWGGVDWIGVAQDKIVIIKFPYNFYMDCQIAVLVHVRFSYPTVCQSYV
jgi:hypothetical protein